MTKVAYRNSRIRELKTELNDIAEELVQDLMQTLKDLQDIANSIVAETYIFSPGITQEAGKLNVYCMDTLLRLERISITGDKPITENQDE